MGAYTVNNGKIYGLMGFDKSSKLNDLDNATLNELEWNEIQYVIQSGKFGDYFNVGDTKDITLDLPAGNSASPSDGTLFYYGVSGTYKVVVLGIDHNSEYEGTNRVHFCIGQDSTGKEIAFRYKRMNTTSTNVGGWASCPMKTFLNTILLDNLPSDLTSVISTTTKFTDNTGNSSNVEANVTATSDKLWLLSEFEVFGDIASANLYERYKQQQYAYYKNKFKQRRMHYDTVGLANWWVRSATSGDTYSFCYVDQAAEWETCYADVDLQVVPCFTIS